MQDETILFNPSTNKFCLLNATAAFLWERLQNPCTIEEASTDLCRRFAGVDAAQADQDVRNAIQLLTDLALVIPEA